MQGENDFLLGNERSWCSHTFTSSQLRSIDNTVPRCLGFFHRPIKDPATSPPTERTSECRAANNGMRPMAQYLNFAKSFFFLLMRQHCSVASLPAPIPVLSQPLILSFSFLFFSSKSYSTEFFTLFVCVSLRCAYADDFVESLDNAAKLQLTAVSGVPS